MNPKCPICKENYYLIKQSQYVCKTHETWLVTTCSKCNKVCFSDCKGICVNCGAVGDYDRTAIAGKKYPRASLIYDGYEEYE